MQVNAQDQNEQDISERRNNQPPKYHCSYCLTPLNGQRIKCAVCVDFDLCTTCFAVGVEIGGHKIRSPPSSLSGSSPPATSIHFSLF
mmetsp:Transcript_95481/g.164719  ORF Transcript_95481/g.164719 Transcript_95481/m.164719 type:complete len:87 (-) Transcript_95481:41-301(-)